MRLASTLSSCRRLGSSRLRSPPAPASRLRSSKSSSSSILGRDSVHSRTDITAL